MGKVLPFCRKEAASDIDQRLELRFAETDRLTMQLINNEPVVIKGIEYSMSDVFVDLENSEDLRGHLVNLLQAEPDQEPECVSKLNRFLIAGARELAFRLTADLQSQRQTNPVGSTVRRQAHPVSVANELEPLVSCRLARSLEHGNGI